MMAEQGKILHQIARFGLPLVVAVFYGTAAWHFAYTPESTFCTLQWAGGLSREGGFPALGWAELGGTPHPLWILVPAAGDALGIDPLQTAKVFSLFFSCVALLVSYLVAVELLGDRLLALLAGLIIAMGAGMLQMAPSGSSVGMALAVSLGTLYFLLRNEYLPAVVLGALSTLLFWQSVVLVGLLILDIVLNSRSAGRGLRVAGRMLLVYLLLLLPWIGIAVAHGTPWRTELISPTVLLPSSWTEGVLWGTLFALTLTGLVLRRRDSHGSRGFIRLYGTPLAWGVTMVLFGFLKDPAFAILGWPVLVIYAMDGFVRVQGEIEGWEASYVPTFVLAALLLLAGQIILRETVVPRMDARQTQLEDVRSLSAWLRSSTTETVTVASDLHWSVGYYAGRTTVPLSEGRVPREEFVVTSGRGPEGYTLAFRRNVEILGGLSAPQGSHAVWVRK